MANLNRKAKSFNSSLLRRGGLSPTRLLTNVGLGEETASKLHPVETAVSDQYVDNYEDTHPLGMQVEQSAQAVEAAEAAATQAQADAAAEKKKPVMPTPDDLALSRAKKKNLARRNRGRASTILADTTETLG